MPDYGEQPEPAYTAYPRGPGESMPREAPWGFIWGVAAVLYVVALVVALQTGDNGGYAAGRALGAVLLPLGAVALIARTGGKEWPSWVLPIGLLVGGLLMIGAVMGPELVAQRDLEDDSDVPGAGRTATVPQTVGEWSLLDNGQAQAAQRQRAQQMSQFDPSADFTYGLYKSGADRAELVVILPAERSDLHDELRDPRQILVDFMGGAGISNGQSLDPGGLGGSMRCGSYTKGAVTGLITCVWADRAMLGFVNFGDPDVLVPDAAEMTRAFREAATVEP